MYRRRDPDQLSFADFYVPFGGKLSAENRWVKLAALIPWEQFEAVYAEQFDSKQGAPAKSFRVALGALIIKERLKVSDEETVEQIKENPYLQYFLGYSEYQEEAPFDASMMVHFRKRLSIELIGQVNEAVVETQLGQENAGEEAGERTSTAGSQTDEDDKPSPPNHGKLILDATCAPVDIRYPTDLGLLNQARKASEAILDELYVQVQGSLIVKPRTYRRLARKAYLTMAKQRRPGAKKLHKGIRQQLGYLKRNLGHIDRLLEAGASLTQLSKRQYRQLLVLHEVYRQQQQMYETRTRRIDARIVSLSQPQVRPIVRGKAGTPVEFGPKLSVSCVDGFTFLDELSWDNFNESGHLQSQAEAFRRRFGHYPASIHADRIYRTRENLQWCKARGIRLSGPPLGRPVQDPLQQAVLKQQARDDERIRVQIEGKFGQAKRRFSLARVMPKLAETAATSIAITFLVMNLERALRLALAALLSLFFGRLEAFSALYGHLQWVLGRKRQVRPTGSLDQHSTHPRASCHFDSPLFVFAA